MPRPFSVKELTREALQGLARDEARARLRCTAAVLTTMSALAATSIMSGHSAAGAYSPEPCALERTGAHHSEGLNTWNRAYPRPTRPLDSVMVFLAFPDSRPRVTPDQLVADHFPETTRFYQQASYGRFRLRTHPLRRWIRMPKPSTAYAIQRDWQSSERSAYLTDALAATDPLVDFSRYDIVYFVADPDAPGVDSDATKVVNLERPLRADGTDIRRVVTVFEQHPPDRLVLAHETGHAFDLPDLYRRPADGKGDWDTLVGDWDLMGSQFGLAPDLFAWHKWKLGWLKPSQVVCVSDRGPTRLTLDPVEEGGDAGTGVGGGAGTEAEVGAFAGAGLRAGAGLGPGADLGAGAAFSTYGPFGAGGGTKLAVVRTGRDSALAIEARSAIGSDVESCAEGVLVYRVRSATESGEGPIQVVDAHPHTARCFHRSVYPPLADAPVGLGESFTVPGENVRVQVQSRTASGAWTVRITPA